MAASADPDRTTGEPGNAEDLLVLDMFGKIHASPPKSPKQQTNASHSGKTKKRRGEFPAQPLKRKLTSNSEMDEHIEYLADEKLYKCGFCDSKFKMKGFGIYEHIQLKHLGEAKYNCIFCDRRFLREHVVTEHEKGHFDRMFQKCYTCHKVFDDVAMLNRHIDDEHGGVKGFFCSVCRMQFDQKRRLLRHEMFRCLKGNTCYVCSTTFAKRGEMVRHIQDVHGYEVKPASLCDK